MSIEASTVLSSTTSAFVNQHVLDGCPITGVGQLDHQHIRTGLSISIDLIDTGGPDRYWNDTLYIDAGGLLANAC